MLVVPADELRPRRPDEHFAAEAVAAADAGLKVALVDHDARGTPGAGAGRHWWARLSVADLENHQLPDPAGPYHRPDGW
jgi:hypothetical protein